MAEEVTIKQKSKLYYVPKTIASPIVQVMLELNLVPDEVELVSMEFSDLKKSHVLDINPMGTSPTFVTNSGISMWESGAVISWILNEYDKEFKLHPATHHSDARATYLQVQQFIIATVYPFVAKWFVHTLKPALEQDSEFLTASEHIWRFKMGPILNRQLGDGEFLLSVNLISAVDFLVAKPLGNLFSLGELESFPKLKMLLERVKKRSTYDSSYSYLSKSTV